MSIDFKNNIKNIRTTSPDFYLFAGSNCPEPCLKQFFQEYIPICNQKSAFSSAFRYLLEVTVQNHALDSFFKNIYQFAIKSLLSVLLSSSTACNFKNSRAIYVILWEMKNHDRSIWFMKIETVRISLYFWNNSFKFLSTFYLIFKEPSFKYQKVRHPNFL